MTTDEDDSPGSQRPERKADNADSTAETTGRSIRGLANPRSWSRRTVAVVAVAAMVVVAAVIALLVTHKSPQDKYLAEIHDSNDFTSSQNFPDAVLSDSEALGFGSRYCKGLQSLQTYGSEEIKRIITNVDREALRASSNQEKSFVLTAIAAPAAHKYLCPDLDDGS